MVDVRHLRSVPVDQLRYGLYVVEPDRPWTEIPLMFQGFEISTDEELEVLRSYCEQVYVDADRCTANALEALERPIASTLWPRPARRRIPPTPSAPSVIPIPPASKVCFAARGRAARRPVVSWRPCSRGWMAAICPMPARGGWRWPICCRR